MPNRLPPRKLPPADELGDVAFQSQMLESFLFRAPPAGTATTSSSGTGGAMVGEPEAMLPVGTAGRLPRLVHLPRLAGVRAALGATTHLVAGGTAGLGLLTARWLAHCGAAALALASRGGVLAHDTTPEWAQLHVAGTATLVQRCDTAELTHVEQLTALTRGALAACGMWHAAGVLADGVLLTQAAV